MRKRRRNNLFSHLFLTAGAFVMVFPLLWLLSSAFKNNGEIFSANFSFIPRQVTAENFKNGWNINKYIFSGGQPSSGQYLVLFADGICHYQNAVSV